jgi:nitrate/TMAO reductase-like tetraheme cytochrome c subunit
MTIVAASAAGILFLFVSELLEPRENPYLGIFTYVVFPGIMIFGLFVVLLGMVIERSRRRRTGATGGPPYPSIDLNDPRRRRSFVAFLFFGFVFLFISAFGSYRAFEYTESVAFCGQVCHTPMYPEFTAYKLSPHARVTCVDCHVGPGADWYVKSKLSGAYQVYAALFNRFPRPIPTPVHDLRPAQQTCEQCHWPEKFFGAQLKVFDHYGYDEQNTHREIRMLINTGGGSPTTGIVAGIHWHMNIANQITYIATDPQRQMIPWVQLRDRNGNITEYFAEGIELAPQEIESATKRRMDCVDCHNRPSHIYVQPDRAVNDAFVAGKMDPTLPFIKHQAVEALSAEYDSTEQAVAAIGSRLDSYYKANYPAVYSERQAALQESIAEVQRIYRSYFFPEMKVDWRTHPDNIGHYFGAGCFRCHDGKHASKTGKVIRTECNICHTVLDQTEAGRAVPLTAGAFRHPMELDVSGANCTECHSGKGIK